MDSSKLIETARRRERRGQHAAARATFESVLHSSDWPEGVSRAAVLRWIGNTHRAEGNGEAALDCYRNSLAAAVANDTHVDIAHALNWIGIAEQERGAVDVARQLYTRAMARAELANDSRLMAMISQNLGAMATMQGEHGLALMYYRRSLQAYRAINDTQSLARLLNNMGVLNIEMRSWEEAAATFDEAAQLSEQVRDFSTRAMIEVNRTDLWFRQGDLKAALRCCKRARNLANRVDHAIALGETCKWYGILYRELGSLDVAETHLAAAAEVAERYQNLLLTAEVQRERALLHRLQQRNHAALQALNDAHRAFGQLHAQQMVQDIDQIMRELEEIFLDIVRHWGDSIEEKDRYTRGHCERVADYTCMLARAAGFDEKTLVWIRMGAFLHDVGKTAIPAEILNKNGPLSPEEWRVMQRHTVIGQELLSAIEFPWDIRGLVRSHHEHWAGTGYPDGLAGEQIPLEARILCVADVYDALTTTRAYRPAHTPESALQIMKADAGRIFDPRLMAMFERLIASAPRNETSAA
jgi:putative nucleotidyltransferase with HDIG domain